MVKKRFPDVKYWRAFIIIPTIIIIISHIKTNLRWRRQPSLNDMCYVLFPTSVQNIWILRTLTHHYILQILPMTPYMLFTSYIHVLTFKTILGFCFIRSMKLLEDKHGVFIVCVMWVFCSKTFENRFETIL